MADPADTSTIALIAAGAGGLAGIVTTALAEHFVWRKQKKIETTMAFFDSYHSLEMMAARSKAWALFKKSPDLAISDIENEPDLSSMSVVLHYFERIAVMGKRRLIDCELAREMIGPEFLYWNSKYFLVLADREKQRDRSEWLVLFNNLAEASKWLLSK